MEEYATDELGETAEVVTGVDTIQMVRKIAATVQVSNLPLMSSQRLARW
jgi:hypothetical protein